MKPLKLTPRYGTLLCLLPLLLTVFSGCAPTAKSLQTPGGKAGFSLACDGAENDLATCYSAARAACKGNYKVISQNQGYTGLTPRLSMVVECD